MPTLLKHSRGNHTLKNYFKSSSCFWVIGEHADRHTNSKLESGAIINPKTPQIPGHTKALVNSSIEMLALHPNRKKAEEYFPNSPQNKPIKLYEYNAAHGTKKIALFSESADWLWALDNASFVFQCLCCYQEMTFRVAFWTHDNYLNRSHLLTKKHKARIHNQQIVGLLFNSSKKFIICSEDCFESGDLFNNMKCVQRQIDKILKNPGILNQVTLEQYKLYTFDKQNHKLKEFEYKDDIVKFMQLEIKPLFKFHCMLCDKQADSFTKVVKHLKTPTHKKKMEDDKVALLSVRDFNIFIACSFNKLTSFMYVEHPNSFLKEIIVGSDSCVIISGVCTNEKSTSKEIMGMNFSSIKLPDNKIIQNKSVQVRTVSDNEELLLNSQNNVTIYEFSDNIVKDHNANNLISSVLSNGCRIWCSRCSLGIYSSDEFQCHMSDPTHKARIRNNEQVGFMCYTCKIFFIELKGDSLSHVHKSMKNKNVIKTLDTQKLMIDFNTPLNKSINKIYCSMLDNLTDSCLFSCLSCFDLTKKKLSFLPNHETNKTHTHSQVFTLCEYCNVIYISAGDLENPPKYLKEHFETHLKDSESRVIKLWYIDIMKESSVQFDMMVNYSPFKVQLDLSLSNCKKILVSSSRYFSQLAHPGISKSEFHCAEEWTEPSFLQYVSLFYKSTHFSALDNLELIFTCLKCNNSKERKSAAAAEHCFKKCAQMNPVITTYIKYCDICNEVLLTASMEDIQNHFLSEAHILRQLLAAGISNINVKMKAESIRKCQNIFPTEGALLGLINEQVKETKSCWLINDTREAIKKDCLQVLRRKYPSAQVLLYGSQISGLALKNSDFDLCFDVGENEFDKVNEIFKEAINSFELHVSLPEAHKPIFRLTHRGTGCQCDVSLSLVWEVHCARLIKLLINYDERVHWLLVAVRHWAKEMGLRRPGVLNSNQIIWLVLFYLMQPDVKIIPHISYIFDAWGGPSNITNKDIRLTWNNYSVGPRKTKLDLLEGFFHYYSLINFSKYLLSPYSGNVLPQAAGDDSPWNMEDPFTKENLFERSNIETCQKFQALCFITLNSPWRIK